MCSYDFEYNFPQVILAKDVSGSAYRSSDDGSTWNHILQNYHIAQVILHEHDHNRVRQDSFVFTIAYADYYFLYIHASLSLPIS